jgi:hypothetical protein
LEATSPCPSSSPTCWKTTPGFQRTLCTGEVGPGKVGVPPSSDCRPISGARKMVPHRMVPKDNQKSSKLGVTAASCLWKFIRKGRGEAPHLFCWVSRRQEGVSISKIDDIWGATPFDGPRDCCTNCCTNYCTNSSAYVVRARPSCNIWCKSWCYIFAMRTITRQSQLGRPPLLPADFPGREGQLRTGP